MRINGRGDLPDPFEEDVCHYRRIQFCGRYPLRTARCRLRDPDRPVPYFFACHNPTKNSAGTTSFVVIFSSLFGVIEHSAFGTLDLLLIDVTAVAVFISGTLGARNMVKIKPGPIKVGFGIIMWVFALQLVLKLLHVM